MSNNVIMSRKQIISLIKSVKADIGVCALMHLANITGRHKDYTLSEHAAKVTGLTHTEAAGLMGGWDLARWSYFCVNPTAYQSSIFLSCITLYEQFGHLPGYSFGQQLGAEIFYEIYGGPI